MIEFIMEWREVQCTAEPCTVCKEPIYGKQYQLFTVINEAATPMPQIVCSSCYMEIEKEED
jgi:hypothetical protein